MRSEDERRDAASRRGGSSRSGGSEGAAPRSAAREYAGAGVEPSLAEMMRDPLVHVVMRRDGPKPEQVWRTISDARRRLPPSSAEPERSSPR